MFVINEPKGDRTLLGKYGEIVQLAPGWVDNSDLPGTLRMLVIKLQEQYQDGDFMVMGGHAKMNMVAFHWVLKHHRVLRQLLPKRDSWFIATHDERTNDDGTEREWYIPS